MITRLHQLQLTSRCQIWCQAWHFICYILPGDEYSALELLIHVLLNPSCIKLYCEHHAEEASIQFDINTVTDLCLQQLGDGKLIEHSQTLHFNNYNQRFSLHLLPYHIIPLLPLQETWFYHPLVLLRNKKNIADSYYLKSASQAIALLSFLYELEISPCSPFLQDCLQTKLMRFYSLLHIVFGGEDLVYNEEVQELVMKLIMVFKKENIPSVACHQHIALINKLEEIVPKKEVLGFLETLCNYILEEYYSCSFVLSILLMFVCPCRDWNYRVLILNYFFDHDSSFLLLQAAYEAEYKEEYEELKQKYSLSDIMNQIYTKVKKNYQCVWEENEDMIEMYIRLIEQAAQHLKGNHPELVLNPFSFAILHYIEEKKPRYLFFEKLYRTLTNAIFNV